mmetsp:Transcript_28136/g.61608  ORF Transcript_28136/g.61608 Transcript_28136/m.61608 type:complete len:477 (-) Transcript_28136:9-1439(-)
MEAPRRTEDDLLRFVDKALERNRERVLNYFRTYDDKGDAVLSQKDLHDLLLGCLPKGEMLYRREARLFMALVDPQGQGGITMRELEHNVKVASHVRQQVLETASVEKNGSRLGWKVITTMIAQCIQGSDVKKQFKLWQQRTGTEPHDAQSVVEEVDALGVLSVLKAAVPHIEQDDLQFVLMWVFLTNVDRDGLLTAEELRTALKSNVIPPEENVCDMPTGHLRRWDVSHGKLHKSSASATRCLHALMDASASTSNISKAPLSTANRNIHLQTPASSSVPATAGRANCAPTSSGRLTPSDPATPSILHLGSISPGSKTGGSTCAEDTAPASPSPSIVPSIMSTMSKTTTASMVPFVGEVGSLEECFIILHSYLQRHPLRVRHLFKQYRSNRSDALDVRLLSRIVRRIFIQVTQVQLDYVMAMIMINNDPQMRVDYSSWCALVQDCQELVPTLRTLSSVHESSCSKRIRRRCTLISRS